MKKRLPSIVVIGGTLLAVLMIYLWPYIFPPKAEIDSDKDGFIDRIDRCDDQFSKTNLGCPKKPTINEKDRDGDGYLFGFQKDASLQDPDDTNPCDPDPTCAFCDTDGDGTLNKFEPENEVKNEVNKVETSKINNITLNSSLQKIEWEGDIPEIKVKINLGGTKSFTCSVKQNSSIELTRDQKKDILHCLGEISLSYYDDFEQKVLPITITNGSRIHCYNLFKESN